MPSFAPVRQVEYRGVILLWIAFALNYANRQAVFSIYPALSADLGLSRALFGVAGTVFLWVYSLSMPVAGILADATGRRWIIIASVALWSCTTVGTAASGSASHFLVWRAFTGVAEAFYLPAALGWIAVVIPPEMRSRALAVHASAQFAGIIGGSWYGGWIADHIGWRSGFQIIGFAGILYAVILALFFRGLPDRKISRKSQSQGRLAIFRSKDFLLLLTAFFSFCFLLWIVYAWLPTFVYERFHLSMTSSGITSSGLLQLSAAAGVLSGGVWGDWASQHSQSGRLRIAAVGMLISAPCAWFIFAAHSLILLQCAAAGFGLFSGLFVANIFAVLFDVVADGDYSLAAGVLNTAGGIAAGIGIFLGGISGRTGLLPLVSVIAVIAAGMAAVMVLYSPRHVGELSTQP